MGSTLKCSGCVLNLVVTRVWAVKSIPRTANIEKALTHWEHFNFRDNRLIGRGMIFSALRIRESVATLSIFHVFLLNSFLEPFKRVQRISAPALGPRSEKIIPRPC